MRRQLILIAVCGELTLILFLELVNCYVVVYNTTKPKGLFALEIKKGSDFQMNLGASIIKT